MSNYFLLCLVIISQKSKKSFSKISIFILFIVLWIHCIFPSTYPLVESILSREAVCSEVLSNLEVQNDKLIPDNAPPKVKLPDDETEPVSVSPLTEPVPVTLVTVPPPVPAATKSTTLLDKFL